VRIRAKRARYAAEAVAPAVGKEAKRFAAAVEGVQEVLGDHQDTVVAEERLRAHLARLTSASTASDSRGPHVAFALGALVGDERAERAALRRDWPAAWERAAAPRRWHWLR